MGYWDYGMDWWMWVLMIAGTLGLWVTAIAVARSVFPARRARKRPAAPAGLEPARMLDERLARGEIGVEDYHRARKVLTGAR